MGVDGDWGTSVQDRQDRQDRQSIVLLLMLLMQLVLGDVDLDGDHLVKMLHQFNFMGKMKARWVP